MPCLKSRQWLRHESRFWLWHEDFRNPTRQRVAVNIENSSLTRRVTIGPSWWRPPANRGFRNPMSLHAAHENGLEATLVATAGGSRWVNRHLRNGLTWMGQVF